MSEKPTPAALSGVAVLHPPLVAVYRVLLLYAANMGMTPLSALVRPLLVLSLGAIALWLVLWGILRQKYKAGLVASILIMSALTGWYILQYGIEKLPSVPLLGSFPPEGFYVMFAGAVAAALVLMARWLKDRRRTAMVLMVLAVVALVGAFLTVNLLLVPVYGARPAWAMVVYALVVLGAVVYVIVSTNEFKALTQTANWFAIILVAISVAQIAIHRQPSRDKAPGESGAKQLEQLASPRPGPTPRPDIYLIVLEGYARADVLRNHYGFNNEATFLTHMRELGFHVYDKSFSSYSLPLVSLASCLNMGFAQELSRSPARDQVQLADLLDYYNENRLYRFLKSQGYEITAFSPGIELLEPRAHVDKVLRPDMALSEFEAVLLRTSAFSNLQEVADYWRYGSMLRSSHQLQRERVLYVTRTMGELAAKASESPRFFFAHLLIPEPPFIFDREGEWPSSINRNLDAVSGLVRTTLEEYEKAYKDQLLYTNGLIQRTVNDIIAASKTPPVIVVVSTCGPGAEPSAAGRNGAGFNQALKIRLANLIMVRIPPEWGGLSAPGEVMASVNVFRVVLNDLFDSQLPLEPDKAYLCRNVWPVKFEEVPVEALSN